VTRERWLLVAGALLYLLSLALPAVRGSGFPEQSGLDMLRQGADGWRSNVFAWYANPALWLGIVLIWFGRNRLGLGAVVAGLLLALSSFAAATMAGYAGRSIPPFSYAIGFYVWLGAFVLVLAAAWSQIYKVSSVDKG
jgi:hypothetical protein